MATGAHTWLVKQMYRSTWKVVLLCIGQNWKVVDPEQYVIVQRKIWNCSRFYLIFSAREYFPTNIRCMAWCMHNLSSIHRLRKNIEVGIGLHHAVGAPWWTCKMMIFEFRWHRTELSPRTFESPPKLIIPMSELKNTKKILEFSEIWF